MTKLINLYGAPGSGKSTAMAHIFSYLKYRGVNAEMVTEYAKELCWEGTLAGAEQESIFKEQSSRLLRLNNKVDIIITDSPLFLSSYYSKDSSYLGKAATVEGNFSEVINVFIERGKRYNPKGRLQTEAEAKAISEELSNMSYDYRSLGLYENIDKLCEKLIG